MTDKKLLIIDDEENMRHMLEAMLSRHGYTIYTAKDGMDATTKVQKEQFEYILCDIRMPEMDGLQFLQRNRQTIEESTVIMMSAYGSVDLALEAMKKGAYDFISKPFKPDEVLLTLKKAEERELLKKENKKLKRELDRRADGFSQIIGSSDAIRAVIDLAEKVALYDTTVLVTGESGTGKELFARGIHAHSPRCSQPFLAINCGSIPSELLESELFGYVKGAFTGAEKDKKGLFEEADGGTLFLDEIGELPQSMQVKLLRVLQENEVRPIGASAVIGINVRIIAATAKDLQHGVASKTFREDLYYRLNVISIPLPPLRQRLDDIPALCDYFIDKYNLQLNSTVIKMNAMAMDQLFRYSWPGNIRELENTIQRGMVLTEESAIQLEHLPPAITAVDKKQVGTEADGDGFSLKSAQKKLEARMIARALAATGGNKSQAAKLLEISYPSLLSKIKEYSL